MVVQNDTLFEKYDRYIFDNFRINVFINLKDSEMIFNCYKMMKFDFFSEKWRLPLIFPGTTQAVW